MIVLQTGYSSPAQSGIMKDFHLSVAAVCLQVFVVSLFFSWLAIDWLTGLSVAQYSVFGSIVTIGGMIGGLVNGKMTDLIGHNILSTLLYSSPSLHLLINKFTNY